MGSISSILMYNVDYKSILQAPKRQARPQPQAEKRLLQGQKRPQAANETRPQPQETHPEAPQAPEEKSKEREEGQERQVKVIQERQGEEKQEKATETERKRE